MGESPDPTAPGPRGKHPSAEGTPPMLFSLRTWIVIYALSGFVALSLEIVWFRVLLTFLKSNSFTFATLLALYLLGVGLGSLVGRRKAQRSQDAGSAFLTVQAAIPISAGAALALLVHSLGRLGIVQPLSDYLAGYDPLPIAPAVGAFWSLIRSGGAVSAEAWRLSGLLVMLYGLVPLFLIGLPTFLMGLSFPLLQKAAQTDIAVLGRRVGWLQAANIVGSMLGASLTGLVLLDWLGSAWTLRLLILFGALFAWLRTRAVGAGRRRLWALLSVLAVAIASPSSATLWSKLHGAESRQVVFAEDSSGVSILREGAENVTTVFVNGLGQSELPFGGLHTTLGALPVLLHPNPTSVAVIGLGSGDTLFGIGGRSETRLMDSIEIIAPQLETLRRVDERRDYAGLRRLLSDTRVRHTFTDGRAFIARSPLLYDVVEADALRPDSAYAGNLYSLEYFQLLRRHLAPGGFGVSWKPTRRTLHTFVRAFPNVLDFGAILVGSNEPIVFDREALYARLRNPAIRDYYGTAGIDIAALIGPLIDNTPTAYGPAYDRAALTDINTDLFPRDEYLVAPGSSPPRGKPGRRTPKAEAR